MPPDHPSYLGFPPAKTAWISKSISAVAGRVALMGYKVHLTQPAPIPFCASYQSQRPALPLAESRHPPRTCRLARITAAPNRMQVSYYRAKAQLRAADHEGTIKKL